MGDGKNKKSKKEVKPEDMGTPNNARVVNVMFDEDNYETFMKIGVGLTKEQLTNGEKRKVGDLEKLQYDSNTKALAVSSSVLTVAVLKLQQEIDRSKDRRHDLKQRLYSHTRITHPKR